MSVSDKAMPVPLGAAKIMGEFPLSPDNKHALYILNFRLDEEGYLDSTQRKMHLIPTSWNGGTPPDAWGSDGVLGMGFIELDGGARPEIVFVTKTGIFRFAPWTRGATTPSGERGLEEILEYQFEGPFSSSNSVVPQDDPAFPPSFQAMGSRLYMTFGDGGGAWVWDGHRLRRFGYTARPNPPDAMGPSRDVDNRAAVNNGGFAARGRIGTLDPLWTRAAEVSYNNAGERVEKATGTDDYLFQEPVGGIKNGRWQYYRVWENEDGAYSPMSGPGAVVTIRRRAADPDDDAEDGGLVMEKLRRRMWVRSLQQGPPGTVATILLRTANLEYLPDGDPGLPRFLHRLPGNVATEWIDDIPDGELGATWQDREPVPASFYFMRHFDGSMVIMRTDGHPSRVWWTEQTGAYGPIPESILAGHWRDVYPETGPITGSTVAKAGHGDGRSMLLIGKREAMHYMAPSYPNWEWGTLHQTAGLEGPGLIQTCPDGTVLWYGNRTFWRWDPRNGSVVDVGEGIRKTLRRVAVNLSKRGVSWIDRAQGEVRFALPLDDSETNDTHFIWDYRLGGWRLGDDVSVRAALSVPGTDLVVVAGRVQVPPGSILPMGTNPSVFLYGRSHPGEAWAQREAVYRSGWTPSPTGMHNFWNVNHVVLTMREAHWSPGDVRSWGDWNLDQAAGATTRTGGDETVEAHHPEDDDIKFGTGASMDAPVKDQAVYGSSRWRARRPYAHDVPIGAETLQVLSVEVSSLHPIAFYNIMAYGEPLSGPVGRTPAR